MKTWPNVRVIVGQEDQVDVRQLMEVDGWIGTACPGHLSCALAQKTVSAGNGSCYARAQVDMISRVQEVLSLPQLPISICPLELVFRITDVGFLRDRS